MATATSEVQSALQAAVAGGGVLPPTIEAQLAQHIREGQAIWRNEFPDIAWTIGTVLEQGGRVGFRYTAAGTHKASGKKASWEGAGVAHVADGKLLRIYVNELAWGRLIDIGIVPASPEDDISGTWAGDLFGIQFTLELQQSLPGDRVTGTLSGLDSSFPVSGTNDPPRVNLTATAPKGNVTFQGMWVSGSQIQGTINGGGFSQQPVTFDRQ
jgi:hypothetical protein